MPRSLAPAPLAHDYEETPLWLRDVPPVPVEVEPERQELPASADVVVVGGGYCGVRAAAELARQGRAVVLLEAARLGDGASARNGGMVIPELKVGLATMTRRYGTLGAEMLRSALAAYDHVGTLIAEGGIQCHHERTGGLLLAHHRNQLPVLDSLASEAEALGEDAHVVPRSELGAEVGSDAYVGGLVVEQTDAVHPAKLHAALVDDARAVGVSLHPLTRARSLERIDGRGFRVGTDRGGLETGDVFVATNAEADGLVPALRRAVLPVGSYILATEPLDAAMARAVLPTGRMCFDTRWLLSYWRLSPDGRMVFGGRTSLAATTVAAARDNLYRQMLRVHPQLAGTRVTHAWGGQVAITRDRLPHCGRAAGVAFAAGCNGTGIALAIWLGTRMAAWLAGAEPLPPFAQLPLRSIPLRTARSWWLPVLGAALRVRDRVGR